jgi:HSP20 family protein
MRALTLFDTPVCLPREIHRFFERFMDFGPEAPARGNWWPRTDIVDTKEAIVAIVELPGIEPAAMRVEVKDDVLTIAGEKKEETPGKDGRHYSAERLYGRFERAVRLPVAVDETMVTAAFKNGVLTVTMPKTAAAAGTAIRVDAA